MGVPAADHVSVIRLATVEDVESIHRMVVAIAAATGGAGKVRSSAADLAEHGFGLQPAFTALLAEIDGLPCGLSLFFPSFSTWRGRIGVYIQDFYVGPEVRGHGVADALLAATAAHAAANGGTYVRLSVAADNHRAQRFYARAGMVHSDDEHIYVLDGAAFATAASRAAKAL